MTFEELKNGLDWPSLLPYKTEPIDFRLYNLQLIVDELAICIKAGDYHDGALQCTHHLREWLRQKFDMPIALRVELAKMYYSLALAPGLIGETFKEIVGCFGHLVSNNRQAKIVHYRKIASHQMQLDWRPLARELSPRNRKFGDIRGGLFSGGQKSLETLGKLASFARIYFAVSDWPEIMAETIPYFDGTQAKTCISVIQYLYYLLPIMPQDDRIDNTLLPQYWLPSVFHLWNLCANVTEFDRDMVRFLERLTSDYTDKVELGPYEIFSEQQARHFFTAVFRLFKIPVGGSSGNDHASVNQTVRTKTNPDRCSSYLASIIVNSLGPNSTGEESSDILTLLENLLQAVKIYTHPSNSGSWSMSIGNLVSNLVSKFQIRWNEEHQPGKIQNYCPKRHLTPEIKRRFVLILRENVFFGMHGKRSYLTYADAIGRLADLEPELILPGMLKRVYPSLTGVLETHRTTESLSTLNACLDALCTSKSYSPHIFCLLGLILPAIDANDLPKTELALTIIGGIAARLPLWDYSVGEDITASLAEQWAMDTITAMQEWETDDDCSEKLPDDQMDRITRSATAGLSTFVTSLFERLTTHAENFPEHDDQTSEGIMACLETQLILFCQSLSPDLHGVALKTVQNFIANSVSWPSKLVTGCIVNALSLARPEQTVAALVPLVTRVAKWEILENDAGSKINVTVEVSYRERNLSVHLYLLWHILEKSGGFVQLDVQKEVLELVELLYTKVRDDSIYQSDGIQLVWTYLKSMLDIYPQDNGEYTLPSIDTWGVFPDSKNLKLAWHMPNSERVSLASEIFVNFTRRSCEHIDLITQNGNINSVKERSRELSRHLSWITAFLRGISAIVPLEDLQNLDSPMDRLNQIRYPAGAELLIEDSNQLADIVKARKLVGVTLVRTCNAIEAMFGDDSKCASIALAAVESYLVDIHICESCDDNAQIRTLYNRMCSMFKNKGWRKRYPQSVLAQRVLVYHSGRRVCNSHATGYDSIQESLVDSLCRFSGNQYVPVRLVAQSFLDVVATRFFFLRKPITKKVLDLINSNDESAQKGGIFTVTDTSLFDYLATDFSMMSSLARSILELESKAKKTSIKELCERKAVEIIGLIATRPKDRTVVGDEVFINFPVGEIEVRAKEYSKFIRKDYEQTMDVKEKLRSYLHARLKDSAVALNWRNAKMTLSLVVSTIDFESPPDEAMIRTLVENVADRHPDIRGPASAGVIALGSITMKLLCTNGDIRRLLKDPRRTFTPNTIIMHPEQNEEFTQNFLETFSGMNRDIFIDGLDTGWLVWTEYDAVTSLNEPLANKTIPKVRKSIEYFVEYFSFDLFKKFLDFSRLESKDESGGFRISIMFMLAQSFRILVTSDKSDLVTMLRYAETQLEGLEDKFEHRALCEIMVATVSCLKFAPDSLQKELLDWLTSLFKKIMDVKITPDTLSYWVNFVTYSSSANDPKRIKPLLDLIADFRLDPQSNSAFKDQARLSFQARFLHAASWPFKLDDQKLQETLNYLAHPYQTVRSALAFQLQVGFSHDYHESYPSVSSYVEAMRLADKTYYGVPARLMHTVEKVFKDLAIYRMQRPAGEEQPSDYTMASKTVVTWLRRSLNGLEAPQYLQAVSKNVLPEVLEMMDVKEDPSLVTEAGALIMGLTGDLLTYPIQVLEVVEKQIESICYNAPTWRHRYAILGFMQIFFYRHLFLLTESQQKRLVQHVVFLLCDDRAEVRNRASTSLTGMLMCSASSKDYEELIRYFEKQLDSHPFPKPANSSTPLRAATPISSTSSNTESSDGDPSGTISSTSKQIAVRHGAVLGLCSLVEAFPYGRPPSWMPDVVTCLSEKASNDPGVIGSTVRKVLGSFKKTRVDTWTVDQKIFTEDQLDMLEGSGPLYLV